MPFYFFCRSLCLPSHCTENLQAGEVHRSIKLVQAENRGKNRGHIYPQTLIALAFLNRYGELNSMPCPTGRGSTDETAVRYLSHTVTVTDVYEEYRRRWPVISPHVTDKHGKSPDQPLMKESFQKIW